MKARNLLALFAVGLALTAPTHAQAQHHPTSPNHPLKDGAKAPSFTLKDQHGNDQSLEAMLQNGKVAVIFHRSANR